jgi:hypothetical protein
MKILEGTLETVSLAEIFRLAESGSRTGGLTVSREGISKTFFFQRGKLIFASSQKEGERIGEFFTDRFGLDRGGSVIRSREALSAAFPSLSTSYLTGLSTSQH